MFPNIQLAAQLEAHVVDSSVVGPSSRILSAPGRTRLVYRTIQWNRKNCPTNDFRQGEADLTFLFKHRAPRRVEEGRWTGDLLATGCFPSPLIKPDVPVSSIRLSDRLHHIAHGSRRRWTSQQQLGGCYHQPIPYGRDSQWPVAAAGLRDCHPSHRLWLIRLRTKVIPDAAQPFLQPLRFDSQEALPIHARRACVAVTFRADIKF